MAVGIVRPHFFEIDVGFPVSSVDLFGRHRRRGPGSGLRRSCELSYVRVSPSDSYSAYVHRLRCEIYLTTRV
jgi:hypothetical protein